MMKVREMLADAGIATKHLPPLDAPPSPEAVEYANRAQARAAAKRARKNARRATAAR